MTGRICGTGACLPKEIWDNDRLSQMVETSDEWIRERTGIRQRHIATGEETTVSLAVGAARAALEDASIPADEIDLLIVATVSPDELFPTTSCRVQEAIGAVNATCFDLNAACTGFLFALNTAQAYISQGIYRTALLIGAERLSNLTNWEDRTTCILFGDGAGAAVVRAEEDQRAVEDVGKRISDSESETVGKVIPDNAYKSGREEIYKGMMEPNGKDFSGSEEKQSRETTNTCGKYAQVTHSVGTKGDALTCASRNQAKYAGATAPETYLQMDGRAVFKFAVTKVPEVILELAEREQIDLAEVKYFVLHQANERIIQGIRKKLKPKVLHSAEGHLREEYLQVREQTEWTKQGEDYTKPADGHTEPAGSHTEPTDGHTESANGKEADLIVGTENSGQSTGKENGQDSEEEYEARFPVNIHETGNTSSASIPILLDQLNKEGKLQRGDKIILAGFGAGLSYGASYMVW